MYCRKCGTSNPEDAAVCQSCGEQLIPTVQPRQPMEPKPDNYLVWSILVTIFCCLIPGIVSIVYAAQVDLKWMMGDYAGAREASNSAKTWALVAFIIGLLGIIIYLAFYGIFFASLISSGAGID